MRHRKNLSKFL